ncbi:MAG TPA: hypothetical protein VGM19_09300 [Armatimonadota bacterium]|jgi:hypothetical protein
MRTKHVWLAVAVAVFMSMFSLAGAAPVTPKPVKTHVTAATTTGAPAKHHKRTSKSHKRTKHHNTRVHKTTMHRRSTKGHRASVRRTKVTTAGASTTSRGHVTASHVTTTSHVAAHHHVRSGLPAKVKPTTAAPGGERM